MKSPNVEFIVTCERGDAWSPPCFCSTYLPRGFHFDKMDERILLIKKKGVDIGFFGSLKIEKNVIYCWPVYLLNIIKNIIY